MTEEIPGRATLVPLMTDPRGQAAPLDLTHSAHLAVVSHAGRGATSALRLLAAHLAAHGLAVDVATARPQEWAGLAVDGGIWPSGSAAAAGLMIEAFVDEMRQAFATERGEGQLPDARRRVLVVDAVDRLLDQAPDPAALLRRLEETAFLGRGAGYHLALSTRPDAAGRLGPVLDCSAVLTLAPAGARGEAWFAYDQAPARVRVPFLGMEAARELLGL
ncbi:hypothetical protein D7231_34515 [Streptomyces klenkii]|uniref:FtsK domain-containing protein n=1 Tax=Streptomyces klenkii TaxID=1420899 RepID=A0A3B0ABE7_9ACTN|nr:hypothetical protein [Streptomyces klenkii]RKN56946.1 hypothetical protein D7231_34515 [Streptomyces klenkii]